MKVHVGLVHSGVVDKHGKFHADTVRIWLEHGTRDTENMHKGNYTSVALAVARRKLQTDVFPIDIEAPEWLPERTKKNKE